MTPSGFLNYELGYFMKKFGSGNVTVSSNMRNGLPDNVLIRGMILPRYYNRVRTNMLLIIPDGYGINRHASDVYVNPGLQYRMPGQSNWSKPGHYFDKNLHSPGRDYRTQGWQWLCINQKVNASRELIGLTQLYRQAYLMLKYPQG